MKNLLIIFFAAILFTSCEKEVNVNIPYDGDKLVLNSLFYADSNIYARVFISQKLNNNYNSTVPNNAVLTLFENNVAVGNFTTVNILGVNWFKSPVVAQVGKTYKIVAAAPGYTAVEGEDIVPVKPVASINSIATIQNNNNNANNNYNRKLKFKINDNGNEENYYLIKVHAVDTNLNATGPRYRFNSGRYGFNAEIEGYSNEATFGGSFGNNEIYLTDETFNGIETSFNLNFEVYNNSTHYALEVVNLSKATYRYLKSVELQQNTQGDPFAEATVVYGNIKNGFGIVGAATEKMLFIKKP